MAQKISQGNIFGRLGSGIGQGLAEQIPKEIEQYQLKSGLKDFSENSQGLDPMQQLAKIASVRGVTPQMIQSFSELAKQQAKGNSLDQQKAPIEDRFAGISESKASPDMPKTPSLTKAEHLEILQKGNVPPTKEEEYQFAGSEFKKNPAKFNGNPEEALQYARDHFQRQQDQFNAIEAQDKRLKDIEKNLESRLQSHSNKLKAKVPANLYSKIEDKAINSLKPKSEGGEGLTEQDAMKTYGKELDAASRDYGSLQSLDLGLFGQSSDKTLRSIKNLQKDARKRGDTENMADTMVAENGTSPMFSYAIFEPVADVPKLSQALKTLPAMRSADVSVGTPYGKRMNKEKTLEIAKKLAPMLKDNEEASPLSVAYELKKKGYDADAWLEYLTNNRKDLNLKENQVRQLEKTESTFPSLEDWWLSSFSGIE